MDNGWLMIVTGLIEDRVLVFERGAHLQYFSSKHVKYFSLFPFSSQLKACKGLKISIPTVSR